MKKKKNTSPRKKKSKPVKARKKKGAKLSVAKMMKDFIKKIEAI